VTALWPIAAIFRRDARIALSYRLNALLTVVSSFFSVLLWFFLSQALTPRTSGWAPGGYFGYVITGTALLYYVNLSLHNFTRKVREDQHAGTLEMLLGSPAPPFLLLSASIFWDMLVKTLQVSVFVILALFFGLTLHPGSFWALFVILALTVIDFMAIGLIAASLLLVFQKGEPVTPFVGALFALLGGVFFPTKTLPPILEGASRLIPLPYALDGLRGVLLYSKGFADVLPSITALLVFAAILVPLSFGIFSVCLRAARRCGLLGKY